MAATWTTSEYDVNWLPWGLMLHSYHLPMLEAVIFILLVFASLCAFLSCFKRPIRFAVRVHTQLAQTIIGGLFRGTRLHRYQVTFVTGWKLGASPKHGQVAFSCAGSLSCCEEFIISLHPPKKSPPVTSSIKGPWVRPFRSGGLDHLAFATTESLGDLHLFHVALRSDRTLKHRSPSWYLTEVIVTDLDSLEKWLFPCHQWLSADTPPTVLQVGPKNPTLGRLCRKNISTFLKKWHTFSVFTYYSSKSLLNAVLCFFVVSCLVFAMTLLPTFGYPDGSMSYVHVTEYVIITSLLLTVFSSSFQAIIKMIGCDTNDGPKLPRDPWHTRKDDDKEYKKQLANAVESLGYTVPPKGGKDHKLTRMHHALFRSKSKKEGSAESKKAETAKAVRIFIESKETSPEVRSKRPTSRRDQCVTSSDHTRSFGEMHDKFKPPNSCVEGESIGGAPTERGFEMCSDCHLEAPLCLSKPNPSAVHFNDTVEVRSPAVDESMTLSPVFRGQSDSDIEPETRVDSPPLNHNSDTSLYENAMTHLKFKSRTPVDVLPGVLSIGSDHNARLSDAMISAHGVKTSASEGNSFAEYSPPASLSESDVDGFFAPPNTDDDGPQFSPTMASSVNNSSQEKEPGELKKNRRNLSEEPSNKTKRNEMLRERARGIVKQLLQAISPRSSNKVHDVGNTINYVAKKISSDTLNINTNSGDDSGLAWQRVPSASSSTDTIIESLSRTIADVSQSNTFDILEMYLAGVQHDITTIADTHLSDLRSALGLPAGPVNKNRPPAHRPAGTISLGISALMDRIAAEQAKKLSDDLLESISRSSLSQAPSDDDVSRWMSSSQSIKLDYTTAAEVIVQQVRSTIQELLQQRLEERRRNTQSTVTEEDEREWWTGCRDIEDQIAPALMEKITQVLEREAETIDRLTVDLNLVAYGGYYAETIVTNAVLHTYAEFSRKRNAISLGLDSNGDLNESAEDTEHERYDIFNLERTVSPVPEECPSVYGGISSWDCTHEEARELIDNVMKLSKEYINDLPTEGLTKLLSFEEGSKAIHCILCRKKAVRKVYSLIVQEHSPNYILFRLFDEAIKWLKIKSDDFIQEQINTGDFSCRLATTGRQLKQADQEDVLKQHSRDVTVMAGKLRGDALKEAADAVAVEIVMGAMGGHTPDARLDQTRLLLNAAINDKICSLLPEVDCDCQCQASPNSSSMSEVCLCDASPPAYCSVDMSATGNGRVDVSVETQGPEDLKNTNSNALSAADMSNSDSENLPLLQVPAEAVPIPRTEADDWVVIGLSRDPSYPPPPRHQFLPHSLAVILFILLSVFSLLLLSGSLMIGLTLNRRQTLVSEISFLVALVFQALVVEPLKTLALALMWTVMCKAVYQEVD